LKTLLDTNEFFSEREVHSAKHILDNGKLGLDQFEALLELLVPDPRRTPRQREGSFGSYLGPFSHLINSHQLLKDFGSRSPPWCQDPLTRDEVAPKTQRFFDPGQHSSKMTKARSKGFRASPAAE
jgi:hypothetical protein